jgi:glycosyltransferase involved in cell wall biosynthesis
MVRGLLNRLIPEIRSVRHTVDSVLSDRDRKERLVRAGLEVSKKFSWSHTAKLTREVYRKAMENI